MVFLRKIFFSQLSEGTGRKAAMILYFLVVRGVEEWYNQCQWGHTKEDYKWQNT